MTRSFLQFVGFASSVVWATLLAGTVFTSSSHAQYDAVATDCRACFACNNDNSGCDYTGSGAGCTNNGGSCFCNSNNGNPVCRNN